MTEPGNTITKKRVFVNESVFLTIYVHKDIINVFSENPNRVNDLLDDVLEDAKVELKEKITKFYNELENKGGVENE